MSGLKGVDGSLTLGGYDSSRFIPNDVSCNFADDISRNLVVGIQAITASSNISSGSTSQSAVSLLPIPILSFIDATVSHIWLSLSACLAFEQVFGLMYDNATELYLINDTLHASLLSRIPSITFTIGNDLSNTATIEITLPYASFDLALTSNYPGIENTTRYFPIRRAAIESQNTLGRTFLQEAYLIADYERSNFSLSQVVFAESYVPNIQAILPPSNASNSTTSDTVPPSPPSAMSTASIIGIAIAAAAVLLILLTGTVFGMRKRRKQQDLNGQETKISGLEQSVELHNSDVDLSRSRVGELHEEQSPIPELLSQQQKLELDAEQRQRSELDGKVCVAELEGRPRMAHEVP